VPKPLTPIVVRLAAAFVLAGAGVAATSARAAATAKPCWERVIDDWVDNGKIDGTYKPACYQAALGHLPEDLRDYTGIGDAIAAALQSSLRGTNNGGGASGSGSGGETGTHSATNAGKQRTTQVAQKRSYYRRAIDRLGPTSADALPIPLLVLAGLGVLLLVAACGLAVRMRLRARAAGHLR
jgi:hypothetical protein